MELYSEETRPIIPQFCSMQKKNTAIRIIEDVEIEIHVEIY
jgi:hypothetical protein